MLRKLPPKKMGIRRLAIPVADHALEYGSFEGTIEQRYGAGSVTIWDQGSIERITHLNHRFFLFHGQKLQGCYTLAPFEDNFLFYKVIQEELAYQYYLHSPNKNPRIKK